MNGPEVIVQEKIFGNDTIVTCGTKWLIVKVCSDASLGGGYRRHVLIQCCNWDKQIGCNRYGSRNIRTFFG